MARSISWTVISIIGLTLLPMLLFHSLIFAQPGAATVYGVHDAGTNDSQFFRLELNSGSAVPLGPLRDNYDIEAMDIHPSTGVLYAIAGGDGNQDGNLYAVDKNTGDLTFLGNTGTGSSDEIVSASFHPDGTLWAFQQNVGLLTVNVTDASTTLQWPANTLGIGDNWEGLAWDLAGNYLYGSQGSRLYRWDPISQAAFRVCGENFLPRPTEALDFLSDGRFLGGWHNAPDDALRMFEINVDTCTITSTDYDIPYNDVESIACEITEIPPTPQPPSGTHKLLAQVFVDLRCDGWFQNGVDSPLPNVPVTLRFANGASRTLQTQSHGAVYFSGFDATGGVRVSVELPAQYRGHEVRNCFNSPAMIELPLSDFESGIISHAQVRFRAELVVK